MFRTLLRTAVAAAALALLPRLLNRARRSSRTQIHWVNQ